MISVLRTQPLGTLDMISVYSVPNRRVPYVAQLAVGYPKYAPCVAQVAVRYCRYAPYVAYSAVGYPRYDFCLAYPAVGHPSYDIFKRRPVEIFNLCVICSLIGELFV